MRFTDMRDHRSYGWARNDNAFAENYRMATSQANIVQILDRESIATIALFYFFNNDKFAFPTFQVRNF
jgi:hypothetical protein